MRKFLKYILKITFSLLVLMVLLDVIYTTVIENSIPRNKIRYAMSIKNKHYDALFLGSSRVQNSIVTSKFKSNNIKVLNMGLEGADLGDNWLMLYFLKNNNVTFDKVFVQLDYLYNSTGNQMTERSLSNLLPLIRDDKIASLLKVNDKEFKKNYYIPFYRYAMNSYSIGFREFVSSVMQKKPRISFEDGYTPLFGTSELKEVSLPKKIISYSDSYNKIDKLCLEMNIKPIYFIAPYCSKLIDNGFVNKLDSVVDNFYDYSRVIKEDKSFKDPMHLNDKGARKFSQIILEDFFTK